MKRFIFLILALLSVSFASFSQGKIDSAYYLFRTIDWTEWNNIDTAACNTNGTKHISRQKYTSSFDKLLCPGVAKDTVDKYLGAGSDFEYSGDRNAGWGKKANRKSEDKRKNKNSVSYCLIYDCDHKEWTSRVIIFYKNGKVLRYTRNAIYY